MIRTVTIGSCVSIQGVFVKTLTDGRVRVRIGKKFFDGWAVSSAQS